MSGSLIHRLNSSRLDRAYARSILLLKCQKAERFWELLMSGGLSCHVQEEEFMAGLFDGVEEEEARQVFLTLSKLEENLMKLKATLET